MSAKAVSEILPDGWHQSELGKVAKWGSGGTPKTGTQAFYGGGIPWAVIGDLTETWVSETSQTITKAGLDKSSAKIVQPGTVMLAMYGASIGRTGIAAIELATNQAIAFAVPVEGVINNQFLLKYIQSQKEVFVRAGQGGAQPNISQTVIKPWPIPVPPLTEQEKIVEILEEQFSRLDAALASVRVLRAKAARFRRSLLHAAFTGALSGHDSPSGTLPEGWKIEELRELVDVLDSMRKPINSTERLERIGTVPYFGATGQVGTIEALFDENLVLLGEDGVQFFDVDKYKAYEISGPSWVNNHAHVLRCRNEKYIQRLLVCFLNQFDYRNYANGTTRLKLTQAAMNRIPVVVPPIKVQENIVEILEEQLSRLDAALVVADAIEKKTSALRRSLLNSAFTGELTREWREGAHV